MPDPLRVDAYNRYMYGLGNPLKFNDPSGHYSIADGGAFWSPLVIFVNGIRQQKDAIAGHMIEASENLASAGYPERSIYVPGPVYTGGTLLDMASVVYQHANVDTEYAGWAEIRIPVRIIANQIRDRLKENEIDLFPGREVVMVAHSGGAPTAVVVGDWLEKEYGAHITNIITLGSILVDENKASEVADQVNIVTALGDPLGYSEFRLSPRRLPPNVSLHLFDLHGHNGYGSNPAFVDLFSQEVPGASYLQQEP